MENNGNPAQRLYNIVMEANQSLNRVRSSGNNEPLSWQVWADVFKIELEEELTLEEQLQIGYVENYGKCYP